MNGEWFCCTFEHVARHWIVHGDEYSSFLRRGFYGQSRRGAKWVEDSIALFTESFQSCGYGALLEWGQEACKRARTSYGSAGNECDFHSRSIREAEPGPACEPRSALSWWSIRLSVLSTGLEQPIMPPMTIDEARDHLPGLLEILRTLVEFESPTPEKLAVDRAGSFVAGQMKRLGARVQRFEQKEVGDHWLGTWGSGPGGILIMAHIDTVHPIGTLKRLPWSEEGGKIYGPGIMDMKASAAIALTAIDALRRGAGLPGRRISLMFNSDEETGSHTSQDLIQSLAKEHDLVLCLEPALPDGALKTWRKGIGMFEIEVVGRMAHAGANPSGGVNAIHEMAHQIRQITELADDEAGTTLNVDLIEGGTRTNVIPARARASLDIRVKTEEERSRIASGLDNLKIQHPEAQLSLTGEWNRPPMPRTEIMMQTFERAREIGSGIGLDLSEGGTGGGSDANFVAPLGIPVLDGLGAVGAGAHTEQEHIRTESLPERTALLAALLTEW